MDVMGYGGWSVLEYDAGNAVGCWDMPHGYATYLIYEKPAEAPTTKARHKRWGIEWIR